MKTNVAKTIILSLVIAVSTAFTATNVSAQSINIEVPETNVDIRYTGNNSEFFKFGINLRQLYNQRLLLRVLDENGVELYRETVNSKDFSKTVKVVRNDYERLQFTVTGSDGISFSKSFTINADPSDNFLIRDLNR